MIIPSCKLKPIKLRCFKDFRQKIFKSSSAVILTSFIESFWKKKNQIKKKKWKLLKIRREKKKCNIDDVDGFVIQGKITLKLSPYTIFFFFFCFSRFHGTQWIHTHTHTHQKETLKKKVKPPPKKKKKKSKIFIF